MQACMTGLAAIVFWGNLITVREKFEKVIFEKHFRGLIS